MKLRRRKSADVVASCKAKLAELGYIAILWHRNDVQGERPYLTDDQCWAVLQHCVKRHDCNFGITWETLQVAVISSFPVKRLRSLPPSWKKSQPRPPITTEISAK